MTQNYLEQALHTYGDELYQTALLLTLDQRRAERTLMAVARNLARVPPTTTGTVPLIGALLAALPAKAHVPARMPWAVRGADATLMTAVSRLPLDQRLALDMLLRRDYEPVQVAPLFANDQAKATQALRDGLLSLAPVVAPELPANLLDGTGADELCQHVRARLAATPNAVIDPVVRAHLAACSACRSAEQAWGRLRGEVERVMRGALRAVAIPAALAERMQAIAAGYSRPPLLQRLLQPRVLQIGLPLAVLLIIALIVLPQRQQTPTSAMVQGSSAGRDPRALIQQALDTLYTPDGEGTWHARYTMRWNFDDNLYATLAGDLWRAPDGRYRVQLTHQDGGAPYEFAMAEQDSFWYARTALYGRSIFSMLHEQYADRVQLPIVEDQREPLLQARLDAGAWGVAGNYLRQGVAAENLSTWGRQRGPDGNEYMVVGFSGVSPLGPPPDAPGMPSERPTILLTIDTARGRLREVREVSGPTGGEQTSRTVWQMNEDGQVEDERQLATLFNIEKAYNGSGRFTQIDDPRGVADPALPMVPMRAVQAPTNIIMAGREITLLPSTPPAGIDRVLVLASNPYEQQVVVYLGTGRFLQVTQRRDPADQQVQLNVNTERIGDSTTKNSIILTPAAGEHYDVVVQQPINNQLDLSTTVQLSTIGFTRAEVLQLADQLAPFDVASYSASVSLFRTPLRHDPAAFAALVGALDQTPLEAGQARRMVERRFLRQGPLEERTPDPYHRPLYSQGGEFSEGTIWARRTNGQLEMTTQRTNDSGDVTMQMIDTGERYSRYDSSNGTRYTYPPNSLNVDEPIVEPTWSVINLLGCGGTTMTTKPDGTRIVTQVDEDWYANSCNRSNYALYLYAQQVYVFGAAERPLPPRFGAGYAPTMGPDEGPYLIGANNQPLTHRIFINSEGRAYRYEARVGLAEDGTLIEASELIADERVPVAESNAAFDAPLLDALITTELTTTPDGLFVVDSQTIKRISLTEAITRSITPLWHLPPDDVTELRAINVVDKPVWRWSQDIFERAVNSALATQLVYAPPISDTVRLSQDMYVGDAARFTQFLRTDRSWESAVPLSLAIDGRSVEGWGVTTKEGEVWTLFELDGSLVAIDTSTPERAARLALLRRAVAP